MDEVLTLHNSFLDKCLNECLLTNQTLLRLLSKLLENCRLFALNIRRYTTFQPAAVKVRKSKKGSGAARRLAEESVVSLAAQEQYIQMIDVFVENFDSKMKLLLEHLKEKATRNFEHHLNNL